MNKAQYAERAGVSLPAVDLWIRRGMPAEKSGKEWQIDPDQADAWRDEYQGSNESLDLTRERARLAKEQADRTAMENAERRGKLIDSEKAAEWWASVITNARMRLLAIPTKVAPLVIGSKSLPEVRDVIEKAIHDALTELSAADPIAGAGGNEGMEAAAAPDSKPVGRRKPKAKSGKQRRAGKVGH